MSVADALRKLHAAGRVRSPWLEGMVFRGSPRGGHRRRIVAVYDDGECLWDVPGTVGRWPNTHSQLLRCRPPADDQLHLGDPATIGCLLALLREAERDPGITTRAPTDPHGGNWFVHVPSEDAWATDRGGPTEGEALAAALVALAEGLP